MMMRALGWNVPVIRISSMGVGSVLVKTAKRRGPHRPLLFRLRIDAQLPKASSKAARISGVLGPLNPQ
jgi:hypothetical protein